MAEQFQSVLKVRNQDFSQSGVLPSHSMQVAFILLDQFSLTSLSTALDVLSTGAALERGVDYRISTWSLEGGMVHSDVGVAVDTQRLALGRLQPQMLVVVGGHRVKLVPHSLLSRVLRRAASQRAVVCGLWNAAFHLAEAGLLDGEPCVCHPDSSAPIREYHPTLALGHSGYAVGHRVGTCADASAVLDLMLELLKPCALRKRTAEEEIRRIHGSGNAEPVSLVSYSSISDERMPQPVRLAVSLMEEHIEEPLDIGDISKRVNLSRRQLERCFVRHLNASPLRYYVELRLTRARQLIVHSNRALTQVALATGFVSYPHFHKRFKEFFGLPPLTFRERHDRQRVHRPVAAYVPAMT
ncbi:GlxA family transcriptional regulator [Pseudomonas benzopyrenica]|uniref:GlxA family transcriptional regulator n=1 Tax=Pseudomonas benzopyrenica TaxID=2993566 RepID=UPI0039C34D9E